MKKAIYITVEFVIPIISGMAVGTAIFLTFTL